MRDHGDWKARIEAAVERGEFDVEDQVDAEDWDSCAVAEALLASGDEEPQPPPERSKLRRLGEDFSTAVANDRFERAEWLVEQIYLEAGKPRYWLKAE